MVTTEAVPSANDAEPGLVSLRLLVEQQQPITLPWCKGSILFGNGFNSTLALANNLPWAGRTAFADLHSTYFTTDTRGEAFTFRESTSSASEASSEHMSMSLGVTVGCKYLNANVTGSFDESTSKNVEGSRASRHGSYRAGKLTFDDLPLLSSEAKAIFRTDSHAFKEQYGDYYVGALQLGGEAGICFTLASESATHQKTSKVSVTAHVLLWDATEEHVEESGDFEQHADFSFSGYNTLAQQFLQRHCTSPGQRKEILDVAGLYMKQIASMRFDIKQLLSKHGLEHGCEVPWSRVMEVCHSGMISHVVLLPYSKLPEYIQLEAEDWATKQLRKFDSPLPIFLACLNKSTRFHRKMIRTKAHSTHCFLRQMYNISPSVMDAEDDKHDY